jgi:hypothetical protein
VLPLRVRLSQYSCSRATVSGQSFAQGCERVQQHGVVGCWLFGNNAAADMHHTRCGCCAYGCLPGAGVWAVLYVYSTLLLFVLFALPLV